MTRISTSAALTMIITALAGAGVNDTDATEQAAGMGRQALVVGDFSRAEQAFRRAVDDAEQAGRPVALAANVANLANVYQEQARYGEAEPLYCRALRLAEHDAPAGALLTAPILNDLGRLEKKRGRLKEAAELSMRARSIYENQGDRSSAEYGATLTAIGNLYVVEGRWNDARQVFTTALNLARQRSTRDPDYALQLQNLGDIARREGRMPDAHSKFDEAIRVLGGIGRDSHPQMASVLNNAALLYGAEGDFDAAERAMVRALEIWKGSIGPDHPEYAAGMSNLGAVFYRKKNYKKAECSTTPHSQCIAGSSAKTTQWSRPI